MSRRRDFQIAFVGLKPGLHVFDYEIDDSFFEAFQTPDFRKCRSAVKLTLDKQNGFLRLTFEIGGQLEVTCDRCNSNLPLELWDEFHMTVKMVEDPEAMNEQEEDPDVFYISRTESHLDVEAWIYEFINLSLPIQKSCGYEVMDGPFCNPEARKWLTGEEKPPAPPSDNPIWKGLERFKEKGLED
jgi:uncharacterized metal-binding protein YceD (DUF177 family)